MSHNASILDAVDPEITDALVTRREVIVKSGRATGLLAAALASGSVPIALGALAGEAYGQAPAVVTQVLRFALLLENLENEFYKAVLGNSALAAYNTAFAGVRSQLTPAETAAFTEIQKHEQAHVTLLRGLLGAAADTYTAANFDFTGGRGAQNGPLTAALAGNATGRTLLLGATMGFEDTGVRAYKGQAGNLLGTTALTTALQIHSVEARHAAKVRRLFRAAGATDAVRYSGTIRGGGATAAGAPSTTPANIVALLTPIYSGATPESNTAHPVSPSAGVTQTLDAAMVASANGLAVDYATQAYDEPLTAAEVVAIVTPFIAAGTTLPPLPPNPA